jgi:hypothetical protein
MVVTTKKEEFFLVLARVLSEIHALVQDLRKNCYVDTFISDLVLFCKDECSPQKMMGRFAINFAAVGEEYYKLLTVLYEGPQYDTLVGELKKFEEVGQQLGKMFRTAINFERYERMSGKFSEYLMTNDDDFDD